jgi:hypothetical protein
MGSFGLTKPLFYGTANRLLRKSRFFYALMADGFTECPASTPGGIPDAVFYGIHRP